jgi:hypothetical protein
MSFCCAFVCKPKNNMIENSAFFNARYLHDEKSFFKNDAANIISISTLFYQNLI